jgi:hypothetical protein
MLLTNLFVIQVYIMIIFFNVLARPDHIFKIEDVYLCIKVRILISSDRIPEISCK